MTMSKDSDAAPVAPDAPAAPVAPAPAPDRLLLYATYLPEELCEMIHRQLFKDIEKQLYYNFYVTCRQCACSYVWTRFYNEKPDHFMMNYCRRCFFDGFEALYDKFPYECD